MVMVKITFTLLHIPTARVAHILSGRFLNDLRLMLRGNVCIEDSQRAICYDVVLKQKALSATTKKCVSLFAVDGGS